ncbi:carbonic anhydrase [Ruicaihuangia caeni]|uniref:Carbonic anhydrase n=1 Tax=Ruicaihuangia caeni TaxID=3042517 RepID=A0AAW6T7I3_9MICO|nr:carbonic anhydrase [Klugiella sp. YN-L-19]MDI2099494.1 carbonic anhydrase [Klugiella sp. YN-L-19]
MAAKTATQTTMTPAAAWNELLSGNDRFVSGKPRHPHQDSERRDELGNKQEPIAALFGCSDSRLAAEIIFDLGLGDLFVIRNAGQVLGDSVLGSIEYAVAILKVPLIIVLGHDQCGAVAAAIASAGADAAPLPPHIAQLIDPIVPAVRRVAKNSALPVARVDAQEVGREHLKDTVRELLERSPLIADAVAAGTLAVAAVNYRLVEGRAVPHFVVGEIDASTPEQEKEAEQ